MPRLRAFFASREAHLPRKPEADLPEKVPADVADVQDEVTDGGHQVASKVADSESDSGDSWPPLDAGEEIRESDRADLNSDSGDSWPPLGAGEEVRESDKADLNSCEKLEADLPLTTDVADVPDAPASDGGQQVNSKVSDSESDSGDSWPPLDAGEEARESERADLNSCEKLEADLPLATDVADVPDVPASDGGNLSGHQVDSKVADSESDSGDSWPPFDAGEEARESDRADLNSWEKLEPDLLLTTDVADVPDAPASDRGQQVNSKVSDSESDSGDSWPPFDAGAETRESDRADLNSCEKLEADLPLATDVADVPDVPASDGGYQVDSKVADSESDSGDSWPPFDAGEEVRESDRADLNSCEKLEADLPLTTDVADVLDVPASDGGYQVASKVADSEREEARASDGEDLNSESGDSLPPLEFIKPSEQEQVESLEPGDLVQLVELRMTELNGEQGYILRLVPGHKEERVEVKMLSTGKMLSVKRSNVRSVANALGSSQRSQRSQHNGLTRALRRGDEVVVQGLTKAVEYNGQRARVTDSDGSASGRVTVELLRSGRQMSLRRDKLRVMVELSDSEGADEDDFSDLPPLRCIRPKKAESKFQIGQKVWLHMKHKPEYHGQQVFVLPSDPLKVTVGVMATVQLSTGKRIIVKESHLSEDPP